MELKRQRYWWLFDATIAFNKYSTKLLLSQDKYTRCAFTPHNEMKSNWDILTFRLVWQLLQLWQWTLKFHLYTEAKRIKIRWCWIAFHILRMIKVPGICENPISTWVWCDYTISKVFATTLIFWHGATKWTWLPSVMIKVRHNFRSSNTEKLLKTMTRFSFRRSYCAETEFTGSLGTASTIWRGQSVRYRLASRWTYLGNW